MVLSVYDTNAHKKKGGKETQETPDFKDHGFNRRKSTLYICKAGSLILRLSKRLIHFPTASLGDGGLLVSASGTKTGNLLAWRMLQCDIDFSTLWCICTYAESSTNTI